MKIFIPSYRRADVASTPALLEASGVTDYKIVIRDTEYKAYLENFKRSNLMVVGADDHLSRVRELTRKKLRNGEWCLHLNDNIRGFIQCNKTFYKKNSFVPLEEGEKMITRKRWQPIMNEKVSFSEFLNLTILDTVRECEKRGSFIAGFASHENPAFRKQKYTDIGYVNGKALLLRNQGMSWNQSSESAGDDYGLTAAHLYKNGRIMINKWGCALNTHYQKGGTGPYEDRLPSMLRMQEEMIGKWGDLFAIKNEGNEEGRKGELRVRFRSLDQVENWRNNLKVKL